MRPLNWLTRPGIRTLLALLISHSCLFVGQATGETCVNVEDYLHIESRLPLPGFPRQAAIRGTTLWVSSNVTLDAVDVSNPSDPQIISSLTLDANSRGIAVRGDYAFLSKSTADFLSGELLTVDISDALSPQVVASTGFSIVGVHLKIVGDRLYASGSDFRVLDISNPLVPQLLGTFSTAPALGSAQFDVEGTTAYLPGFSFGVRILDMSDPANMTLIGGTPLVGEAACVDVVGNLAYVGDRTGGLYVYDVTSPLNPPLLGFTPYHEDDQYTSVHVEGSHAYLNNDRIGVDVVDVSIPTAPVRVGRSFVDLNGADGLFVQLPYLYSLEPFDLRVLDATGPTSVPPLVEIATPAEARSVAIEGDHAFVVDGQAGLQIYNVSNRASPQLVGNYPVVNTSFLAVVSGGIAFIRDSAVVTAVDVTNPAAPSFLSNHPIASVTDMLPVGDHLFVGAGAAGFQVVDYSNPLSPTVIGSYATSGNARNFALHGDVVFLLDDAIGLVALDLQDPTNPTYLGEFAHTDVFDVATTGELLVVASRDSGLTVVDVSDPTSMTQLGTTGPGRFFHVDAAGEYAYATHATTTVFDLSDPTNPVALGDLGSTLLPRRTVVVDDLVWTVDGFAGVRAFPLQCASIETAAPEPRFTLALSPPRPNPFQADAQLTYSIARSGSVSFSVHDVAGRRVRSWPSVYREMGHHEFRWDGRDTTGHRVVAGVYFVRLTMDGVARTSKLTLLR